MDEFEESMKDFGLQKKLQDLNSENQETIFGQSNVKNVVAEIKLSRKNHFNF